MSGILTQGSIARKLCDDNRKKEGKEREEDEIKQ
jgi:hypothetical protein